MNYTLEEIKKYIWQSYAVAIFVSKDPYTLAMLTHRSKLLHSELSGVGYAARLPTDEQSQRLGTNIAIGRAVDDIARQIHTGQRRKRRTPEFLVQQLAALILSDNGG